MGRHQLERITAKEWCCTSCTRLTPAWSEGATTLLRSGQLDRLRGVHLMGGMERDLGRGRNAQLGHGGAQAIAGVGIVAIAYPAIRWNQSSRRPSLGFSPTCNWSRWLSLRRFAASACNSTPCVKRISIYASVLQSTIHLHNWRSRLTVRTCLPTYSLNPSSGSWLPISRGRQVFPKRPHPDTGRVCR
jgi:hypothetical protein